MSDDDWFEQALRELEGDSDGPDTGDDTADKTNRTDNDDTTKKGETVDKDGTAGEDTSRRNNSENIDDIEVIASEDEETAVIEETETAITPQRETSNDRPERTVPTESSGADESTQTPDETDPFGVSPRNQQNQPTMTGSDTADDSFGGFDIDDSGGGGDEFGFADFTTGFSGESGSEAVAADPEAFNKEEFESSIDRIELGIEGLDQMILGGVPNRSLMVVIGSAGTGKTTFGLQFLNHGLEQGERAVFITLEQSSDAIFSTAEEMGWPFREYESKELLAIVSLDPIELANSLSSLSGDITRLIDDFEADRLVLDSVSLLEMMYDHPAKRRSEVFDFTRSLKRAGITTMLTSEASEDNAYASRHGIVEYLTDAVFVLQYVRQSNQETRLAVEIQKIRNANHSRETKPYEITDTGISVYRQASIF
ncbi:KaiC domain-containing protein [Halalkalirubrum salinum]|uniref:KaiC domain-containing protein n=1 Tax=Halalkalirubrum salinum TaxID=2563889 RepID=UPI0010FB22BD|nr:KaiC domain-containing protein [Halalkalirubrum salinum]